MYYSDKVTDEKLKKLERRISKLYKGAYAEMKETASEYFDKFADRYAKEYEAYLQGKYTDNEFKLWVKAQVARGKSYEKFRDNLAQRMTNANKVASVYINDATPTIFNLNRDYEAKVINNTYGADFHLADETTVRRLANQNNHIEFRTTSINPTRDYAWNRKQIHNALASAIMQGKSIDKLADSYLVVMKRNRASAIRNARTSFTSAQNAGRLETYYRAENMGIELKKEWISAHDGRVRDSHAHLDGERVEYDGTFSNGLRYPADPQGKPAEVYNCRCTMRAILPKINDGKRKTYKDWLEENTPETEAKEVNNLLTLVNESDIIKLTRDYNCELAQKLGKEYYNVMCDIVDACENKTLVKVWDKYGNKIKVGSTTSGRAFCRGDAIHINAETDKKGSNWEKPYGVTFHESGHAIDSMARNLGDTFAFHYSSAYNQNEFTKTIIDEVKSLVDTKDKILKAEFKLNKNDVDWLLQNNVISQFSYDYYKANGRWAYGEPKYAKSMAYKALEKEVRQIDKMSRSDLSDMLEGATKGKIVCGYGHGKSYWNNAGSLATEAFAEMTSATLNNPESLATIKQYLPKSYELYNKMLEALL